MQKVFNDTNIKGNEKLLMLALADNSNDSGVCFPSWNKLITKTSMSRNSLAKWLNSVEEKGLLFRKQRGRKNGSKTSNKFLIYPHDNKENLDEEDYILFEDLYTTVPKDELPQYQNCDYPHSTKTMTTTVPKGELPSTPTVPKGELLEPSLISFNRHLLTVTNKKTAKEVIENISQNDNINLDALSEWLVYKKYKTIAPITKTINFLSKYDSKTQQQIIDTSIMNNYQGLFEPKQANIQPQQHTKQPTKPQQDPFDLYTAYRNNGLEKEVAETRVITETGMKYPATEKFLEATKNAEMEFLVRKVNQKKQNENRNMGVM